MHDKLAIAIGVIAFAGVVAQWLATALKLPSVLVLLPTGLLVGPVLKLVEPRELFGDALFPVIAIAVGLILFQGGVGLTFAGAGAVRRPVLGLISVGLLVTWGLVGVAAKVLLGLDGHVALLLGAILCVSGPTVVLPLLETFHLRDPVASVLRWECVVIDPIGAVIAVGLFQLVAKDEPNSRFLVVLGSAVGVGIVAGLVAGLGLATAFRYHLVPDRLHNPLTLATVVACFVAADTLSVEAGLFATTVMGVVLVNQRIAPVAHITAFGEDVFVLLLGGLFVVIGATIRFETIGPVLLPSLGLLAVVLLVRPVAVVLGTIGSGLRWSDRAYLSLIAPRGVVAASVSALFAVSLQEKGVVGAAKLAPVVFIIIIGSVLVASVVAGPGSRWFHVAEAQRLGVVLVGDAPWLVDLGAELAANDVPVLSVPLLGDGSDAAERELLTYVGPLDADEFAEAADAIGASVAVVSVTPGHAGPLVEPLSELLGRKQVFLVAVPAAEGADRPARSKAWGRVVYTGLRAMADEGSGSLDIATVDSCDLGGGRRDQIPLFILRDGEAPEVAGDRVRRPTTDGRTVVAVGAR
jgi:NhaP-type Na+/H+ or K+/H+ antiporter